MKKRKGKQLARLRRHRHVRKAVEGTPERPRLCVFRSNKHIYAQVIDDWNRQTLLSCCTLSPEVRERVEKSSTVQGAAVVGELIGRRCLERGLRALVFDRAGYKYHGRVRALAEAAREQFRQAAAKGF